MDKTGIELIAEERQRQIEVEGWTPERDAGYTDRSLAYAANAYLDAANMIGNHIQWLTEKGDNFADQMFPDKAEEVKANMADDLRDPVASVFGRNEDGTVKPSSKWPSSWHPEWWKPSNDPVRNLVKAGALIAAEIDRIQRQGENNG